MCRKSMFLIFLVVLVGLVSSSRSIADVIDPNFVLWYKLDEAGGTNVEDSSGYDHHGNLHLWPSGLTPTWEPDGGHSGGYLVFGDDTAIIVPTTTLSKVRNGVTVSVWVKDTWRVGQNCAFDTGSTSAGAPFRVWAYIGTAPDAEVLWRAGNDSNDVLRWDLDGSVEDLVGWHHWVFVKDEAAGNIRIYLDGSLGASNDVVDDTLINVRNKPFRIGAKSWYHNDFKGKLDDFMVYDKALSENDVLRLYYTGGDVAVAWIPNPADGRENLCGDVVLSWTAGDYATSHDVYFGTDYDDVENATTVSAEYRVRQEANSYDAGTLETLNPGVTYYWRIDEVNESEAGSPWKGEVWQFIINGGNAFDPDPADGQTAVLKEAVLSWSPGCSAASHDVYFGTDLDDVRGAITASSVYKGNKALGETSYDPCDFDYLTDYYWRIDEVNDNAWAPPGSPWKGQVWRFRSQTLIVDPNCTLWYELDETEGYIAHDSSNFQNDGIIDMPTAGPPVWRRYDGVWGGSLVFKDDTAIWVPTATLSKVSNGVTVVLWVKDGSGEAFHANGGDSQLLVDFSGNQVMWRAGNDSNDVLTWDSGALSGWHHWAFVKDESKGNISIYLDGSLAASNNGVDSTLVSVRRKPFKIGGKTPVDNDFTGQMDDIVIYDRALSGNEVERQYHTGGMVGKLGLAWMGNPRNGQKDVPRDIVLSWKPGDYASSHDVYFGTSFDDVNDAGTSSDEYKGNQSLDAGSYDPGGLDLDTTYYWRIDEIGDSNTYKGTIWNFTVAEYIIIDDMESYCPGEVGGCAIMNNWLDGLENDSGATVKLGVEGTFPVREGEQSMEFSYDNDGDVGGWPADEYSEAEFELDPAEDFTNWDQLDLKALRLYFHGDPSNDANDTERMYVRVEDSNGNYVETRYGDNGEDMNDIRKDEWQQWNIKLSDLADEGLELDYVSKIYLGFGDSNNPQLGGDGVVYFDDIRLYPQTCVANLLQPEVDLNDDCIVDLLDLEIVVEDWLDSDIAFDEITEPSTDGLVGWWKLDDGSGTTAVDSSGQGNDGTLQALRGAVSWAAGHDGGAVEFDGGRILVPDAEELRPTDVVSACAWIYFSESHTSARVVVKGSDNHETYGLEVNGSDELVFHIRDVNNVRYGTSSKLLNFDEWFHIAGTFDGDIIRCYANGVLVDDNNEPDNMTLSQDPNELAIGNRSDDDDRGFEGIIDDVRVYNRVLSDAEIAYLASDGTGLVEIQSVADLHSKEAAGERAVNFKDYAVLIDGWLEQKLWPPLE